MQTVDESVDQIVADYASGQGAWQAFRDIEQVTEDVPWTEVRIEVDPHWDQVHNYLELNRAEVNALVARLRAGGDLPGEERDGCQ